MPQMLRKRYPTADSRRGRSGGGPGHAPDDGEDRKGLRALPGIGEVPDFRGRDVQESVPDRRVIRVGRKLADQPLFRTFAERAIALAQYPGKPSELCTEIIDNIAAPNLAVFLGVEDKRPRALFVGMLPASRAMMAPQALLVYSRKPELSRMIGEAVKVWLEQAGYDRIIGMNLNHKDEPFLRAFRHVGKPQVLGSLVEVRL